MGTVEGGVFLFDPVMRGKLEVKRFNNEYESPLNKNRTVDIVRWLDPYAKDSSKFLVVFDDGTIHFYTKELPLNDNTEKEIITVK